MPRITEMMNRPGYKREWGSIVSHKGYYDRHGKHVLLPGQLEDEIIEHDCGGCLVSLYTMTLRELTQRLLEWCETHSGHNA